MALTSFEIGRCGFHLLRRCRKLRQRPLLTDIGAWLGAD